MDGGYLYMQIRQWIMRPIVAFREYTFNDVLPTFSNLNERADQRGNEYYERMGQQPASEDFDGDMSQLAEEAQDQAISWYMMMRSLRQTMLNLLAAGLFHMIEQQLAVLSKDGGFHLKPALDDTKIEKVAKWYRTHLRLDLATLPSWKLMDELRYVANAVKHGEGPATRKLRTLRPDLFIDPSVANFAPEFGKERFIEKDVAAPMAGEDMFVTEDILREYADGAKSFFQEVADYFKAREGEYF